MNNKVELKFRSTINPLAVGISIILYIVMIVLIITKNPDDRPWVLPVMLSVVVIIIALDVLKYEEIAELSTEESCVLLKERIDNMSNKAKEMLDS